MSLHFAVAGYCFYNSKLLLIHHKNLNMWLPVGGHIDENETPDISLKKEFLEEVGLDIEIISRKTNIPLEGNIKEQLAIPFYVDVHSVGEHDHCCFYYICSSNKDLINLQTDEVTDYKWITKDELSESSIPIQIKNIGNKAFDEFEYLK